MGWERCSAVQCRGRRGEALTVRVPDLADEAHRRRRQRVVFREAQLGGEDAAFEGGAFGALDERFPDEQVVFRYGAGGDAVGRVGG